MKKRNYVKRLGAVGLAAVLTLSLSVSAHAAWGSCTFGNTKMEYYVTAQLHFAGAEMSTNDVCDMKLSGSVQYEDVYGNSGKRSFSAGTDQGYSCHAYMRSGITTYWNAEADFYACDNEGYVGTAHMEGVTE